MSLRSRLSRFTLVLVTTAGLAASAGTASANPSQTGLGNRADNAPGGATTHVDENRPAGAGQGRKIG
ncbi:MAG TPA: hypothetical protein VFZ89_17825 [Solirubrobacteraceae bacterium]